VPCRRICGKPSPTIFATKSGGYRRGHQTPNFATVSQPDDAPSPLEAAIGQEGLERYEAALKALRPADREAIIARIELQQSYEEVAIALGKPSADAARMAVARAVKALVAAMQTVRL
jgi:DNA-directed RNA polymerase specialized sigma24 family protein